MWTKCFGKHKLTDFLDIVFLRVISHRHQWLPQELVVAFVAVLSLANQVVNESEIENIFFLIWMKTAGAGY